MTITLKVQGDCRYNFVTISASILTCWKWGETKYGCSCLYWYAMHIYISFFFLIGQDERTFTWFSMLIFVIALCSWTVVICHLLLRNCDILLGLCNLNFSKGSYATQVVLCFFLHGYYASWIVQLTTNYTLRENMTMDSTPLLPTGIL